MRSPRAVKIRPARRPFGEVDLFVDGSHDLIAQVLATFAVLPTVPAPSIARSA